jgi:hypothetical protein
MTQQDVLGRNRGVGLKLENPMPVSLALIQNGTAGSLNAGFKGRRTGAAAALWSSESSWSVRRMLILLHFQGHISGLIA